MNDLQKINSAYTKTNNPAGFIASSGVLYADKNKTTQLLRVLGFQLPGTQQRSGSIGSVSYIYDDVKTPILVMSAKIDGTYYVVFAAPDAKRKRFGVISAYINKKITPQHK